VKVGDQPTLLIAAAGVMVLCTLVLVRQYGGRVGRTLRRERYRLPLRLFTFSVITFFAAMLLDSISTCETRSWAPRLRAGRCWRTTACCWG
jgi:hypothetical protein